MLNKEVFFHKQFNKLDKPNSLGFSAIFVPPKEVDTFNNRGDVMVWMAITFCNTADKQFNKKIARSVLRERAMELVRARDVPTLLAVAANKGSGSGLVFESSHFFHTLRHFV